MSRYPEFDLSQIQSQPFAQRMSRVHAAQFARTPRCGASFLEFLDSLPHILAGNDIRLVAERVVEARRAGRAVIVSCGGHLVKCGLSPVLVDLMERNLLTGLAINGAVAIHDVEIALSGTTSEDVEKGLREGTFGMAAETARFHNQAIEKAQRECLGAGEALGRALLDCQAPYSAYSLLATGYRLNIPVTVHIALGTDIVHMHPDADGSALGEVSLRDFRILTAAMRSLADGGVLLNIGSAVILPEVLLKAMALLRNQNTAFGGLLGVDMDFNRQHRAYEQIIHRMRTIGGEGIALTGHHEIMVPLLAYAIREAWEKKPSCKDS